LHNISTYTKHIKSSKEDQIAMKKTFSASGDDLHVEI